MSLLIVKSDTVRKSGVLPNRIIASRLGPAQPLAITWNGAGAWLIFSQSRQVNFSRISDTSTFAS